MRAIAKALHAEDGFTLVEAVIAIGIMTMALTMVGSPLINALRYDESWRDGITATTTLQRVSTWMAKDTINATAVSLSDGADPVNTVTLDWNDLDGTPRTSTYTVSSGNLVRTADGENLIIARRVTLVEFSRDGHLLTFTLEVDAATGTTDSKTSAHLLRSLQ